VLPKTYNGLENSTLATLLKSFNAIPMDIEGDVFGKIYEYFLGQFTKAEGQRSGMKPTSTR
jgi:type I restriction enzyme M protein